MASSPNLLRKNAWTVSSSTPPRRMNGSINSLAHPTGERAREKGIVSAEEGSFRSAPRRQMYRALAPGSAPLKEFVSPTLSMSWISDELDGNKL